MQIVVRAATKIFNKYWAIGHSFCTLNANHSSLLSKSGNIHKERIVSQPITDAFEKRKGEGGRVKHN